VKDKILQIEKAQYMMKNFAKQKKEDFEELETYRMNLEWLLQVYEGSMDEKIF
jgi:hypothetical protein